MIIMDPRRHNNNNNARANANNHMDEDLETRLSESFLGFLIALRLILLLLVYLIVIRALLNRLKANFGLAFFAVL